MGDVSIPADNEQYGKQLNAYVAKMLQNYLTKFQSLPVADKEALIKEIKEVL